MATTTTLRPETSGSSEAPLAPIIVGSDLAIFRAGRQPEDRLIDLMAFAIAAEKHQSADPDRLEQLRQEASTALSEHAFRYLHNSVEQIRREAVAEQLGRVGRGPGFGTMVAANLLALTIAGLAAYWLALHPATLAGLAGLLSG
jgi:hypothetical protein